MLGCQCTCLTGLQAAENSHVRLEPDIDRDCLDHAIPGRALLCERSKIKQNPDTYVCFDIPSCGRMKRGTEEIEEMAQADAYADPPPQSSPTEDAAADAGPDASAAVAGAAAELAHSPLEENEEVDAYADPPPPSSLMRILHAYAGHPTLSSSEEDAAADALAAPSPENEGAHNPLQRALPTVAAAPGAPAAPVPAAAGDAAEVAGSQRCRLSEAAQTLPSHC